MAKSVVFTMRLVNLRYITYCTVQNFKSRSSFCRSKPFLFKESYHMFVDPKEMDDRPSNF